MLDWWRKRRRLVRIFLKTGQTLSWHRLKGEGRHEVADALKTNIAVQQRKALRFHDSSGKYLTVFSDEIVAFEVW